MTWVSFLLIWVVVFPAKKIGNLNVLEKAAKMRQTWDKLKNYHSCRVAGAQTLVFFCFFFETEQKDMSGNWTFR